VDRHDRAAVATFFVGGPIFPGATIEAGDAAAHHARVRRVEQGHPVRLTNGSGLMAYGAVALLTSKSLQITLNEVLPTTARSRVRVLPPIADRDRMLWLAEKCAELGVRSWQPVRYARSRSVSPRGEGPAFDEKVRARMIAALEQSSGAWLPEILPALDAGDLVTLVGRRLVLDRDGTAMASTMQPGSGDLLLTFGPEGGIELPEMESLRAAGWEVVSIGWTTLRFETAGVAAAAMAIAAEHAHPGADRG
jgi:16S rRNA (uracil1498-N3)-methyltransferase